LTWKLKEKPTAKVKIVRGSSSHPPYCVTQFFLDDSILAEFYMKNKDLERFAMNILKATGAVIQQKRRKK
jgi:hypothetical protein